MPRVNYDEIEDAKDYAPVPDGKYHCELVDVVEKLSKGGEEYWNMAFKVLHGPHEGKMIYDNMFFSKKSLPRHKLIMSRLGFDMTGEIDLEPDLLKGRRVILDVTSDSYFDKEGKERKKNIIPFAGYIKIEENDPNQAKLFESKMPEPEDDIPF